MNQSEKMTLAGTIKQREERRSKRRSQVDWLAIPGRWALLLALILMPWAFGGVYNGAKFWLTIALLIGLGFWWFETALSTRKKQTIPYLALLVLGGVLIGFLQIYAFPEGIADLWIGRQKELTQSLLGDTDSNFRITLSREGTWRQLGLLVIGLSAVLLGARYFRRSRDIVTLLGVCTANGVLISFFGMINKLAWHGRLLGLDITQGTPFGPFINRNNGAGFLLMCFACCIGLLPIVMAKRKQDGPQPMVSKEMPFWRQFYFHILHFFAELTALKLTVLFSSVLIASGVISSLSRGGVLSLLVGGIGTLLFYGMARRPSNTGLIVLPILLLAAALTGWIGFSEKLMERFNTINSADISSQIRMQIWQDTLPISSDMNLFGAGLGSFRGIHRLYYTGLETGVFEYAENQYVQGYVEAGWPGLVLFSLAWLLLFQYSVKLLNQGQSASSIAVGTFGMFLFFSQAVASIFDFGFYVPANLFQMALLSGFLGYHAHALAARLKKGSWLGLGTPNVLVQVMLLALFALLAVVTLDLYRRTEIDSAMRTKARVQLSDPKRLIEAMEAMDSDEVDTRIAKLRPLIQKCPTIRSLNYLGELYIQRARLEYQDFMLQRDELRNAALLMDEEERHQQRKQVWALTSLQRIQERAYQLQEDVSNFQASKFLNSPFFVQNLPQAAGCFAYSRKLSPLQPTVHLRLAQISAILGDQPGAQTSIRRAIEIAPNNPSYRWHASMISMKSRSAELAIEHLKRYLELNPRGFSKMMNVLFGRSSLRVASLDPRVIVEDVIPSDPRLLYDFSRRWADDPEIKQLALARSAQLLHDVLATQTEPLKLRADVYLAQGNTAGAISSMLMALKSNPGDEKTQFRVTKLIFEQRQLEQALEQGERLLTLNRRNPTYNRLIEEIKTEIQKQEDLKYQIQEEPNQ